MTEPNLHQRLLEYLDEDDDDLVEMLTIGHVFTTGTIAATYTIFSNIVRSTGDRSGPRKKRKGYNHERALQIIHEDYLGRDPLHGEDFKSMFRVSLSTFQYMMEEVGKSGDAFYVNTDGGPSMEARLLLPLKTLAYGVR